MKKYIIAVFIFLVIFSSIAFAENENNSYSAKLRVDNLIEMKWDIHSGDASYLAIYGTDDGDALNRVTVTDRVMTENKNYLFDFLPLGIDYSDYYTFVLYNTKGVEIDRQTVQTTFIMKRFNKKITNQNHPYMIATPQTIEEAKEKIKNYAFYKRTYDELIKMADGWVEYYKDFEGTIPQNPVANNGPMFDAKNAVFYCAEAYVLTDNPKQEWLDTSIKMMKAMGNSYKVLDHLMQQKQDDFMVTKMLCEGYDLIYNYISEADRATIEQDLFRTMAERVQILPGRGILRGGVLNDLALCSIGLMLKDNEIYETGWKHDGTYGKGVYGFLSMMINGVGDDGMWWEQSSGYHEGRIHHFGELGEEYVNSGYDFFNNVFEGERCTQYINGSMPMRRYAGANTYAGTKYMDLIDGLINRVGLNGWIPDFGDATSDLLLNSYGYVNYWERIYGRTGDETSRYLLQLKYGTQRYEDDPNSKSHLNDPKLIFVSNPDLGEKIDGIKFGNVQYNRKGYRKLGVSVLGDMGEFGLRSRGTSDQSTELFIQSCHYGTVSHSHGDKLSITLRLRGVKALADWGTYEYRTPARRQYSKFTAAHNTVLVDRRSQAPYQNCNLINGEFMGDDDGQFTGGEFNDISIGPVSRALMVSNNNAYAYAGVKMNRTVWQIDDYIFDVFNVESNRPHLYEYGMNFNGQREELNAYMVNRDPSEALGDLVGAMMIKNLSDGKVGDYAWRSTWKIDSPNNDLRLRTTTLGEKGSNTNIIAGLGVDDDIELKTYNKNVMFASRNKMDTTFVSVYDPDRNGTFRDIKQLDCQNSDGKSVQAATIDSQNGIIDTVMASQSTKVRRAGNLSSDAKSALLRENNGEETILGCMKGAYVSGNQKSVTADNAITFQLNKMNDGCYRFDMGENSEASVKLQGFDGYKIFRMELSDDVKLHDDVEGEPSEFKALKNTIYIIAKDGAEQNMEAPYVLNIDVPKN